MIKFFVLKVLMFFDYFHKKKILMVLKKLLGNGNKIIFDVGIIMVKVLYFLIRTLI